MREICNASVPSSDLLTYAKCTKLPSARTSDIHESCGGHMWARAHSVEDQRAYGAWNLVVACSDSIYVLVDLQNRLSC